MRARELAPDEVSFEGQVVDEATFLEVLAEAVAALERAGVFYATAGGLASAVLGRPRWTHDIDLLVRNQQDAGRAIEALAEAGFATQRTNEHWLYKGIRRGVLVDVMFKAKGDLHLDEEMQARIQMRSFKGVDLRVIPPEDLVIIKALVHDEETPRHWHDALGVLAASELDWDYFLRRARYGVRRVLSLLLYAESNDLVVPETAIRSLFASVYDE
jgi:hypothetical protein